MHQTHKNISKNIALLGASRGLGGEILKLLLQENKYNLLSMSRKAHLSTLQDSSTLQTHNFDFTQVETYPKILHVLKEFNPHHIFYISGGGPFGEFAKKEYKDHEWAYRLNFLFPSYLLHTCLAQKNLFSHLQQMVFVGSKIAEDKPDPFAASYSASKHAIKGLISSVRLENPPFRLELFSPGYMDTEMLPINSRPRQEKALIENPQDIAQLFLKTYL